MEKEYRRLHLQMQQNAKIKHLFQELLANKTLIEGDYQGPALIGGNHTWWDGLLKKMQILVFKTPKYMYFFIQNDPLERQQTVLALLWKLNVLRGRK